MSDIIPYQADTNIVSIIDPVAIDESFIDLWLRGKSEKTRRAYLADISRFYSR